MSQVDKLVVTDDHQDFILDKKEIDDQTIGQPNDRHICCEFCDAVIIPAGNATKV